MSVELKVGQVWRAREACERTIADNPEYPVKSDYPFKDADGYLTFLSNGRWSKEKEDCKDLIELVQDEKGWRPWKATADNQCPVAPRTLVRIRWKNGGPEAKCRADALSWHTLGDNPIVAYKIEPRMDRSDETTPAIRILQTAANHMRDRAATYDKPEGERSMGKTVEAFNAVTGRDLSESEGWLLLQILKDVRLFQRPGYHADSAEDCVAYAALKAEAKMAETPDARP